MHTENKDIKRYLSKVTGTEGIKAKNAQVITVHNMPTTSDPATWEECAWGSCKAPKGSTLPP